jgi:hypothetical protein
MEVAFLFLVGHHRGRLARCDFWNGTQAAQMLHPDFESILSPIIPTCRVCRDQHKYLHTKFLTPVIGSSAAAPPFPGRLCSRIFGDLSAITKAQKVLYCV